MTEQDARPSRRLPGWLSLLVASALFCVSVAFAAAVVDEYAGRGIMRRGVTAGGVAIGGLTRHEALRAIEADVVGPYVAPFEARVDDQTFTVTPSEFVEVDVEGMIADAYASGWGPPLPARVYRRLAAEDLDVDVPLRSRVDTGALEAWVDRVAAEFDRPAVDATMTLSGRDVTLTASAEGRRMERAEAVRRLASALLGGDKTVDLPVTRLKPVVTEDKLGPVILVRIRERRLYLYDKGELVKTYGVAVGAPGFGTPAGSWRVINKRYMPTWRNPGSAWAKDMPRSIPPGPSNPLGTRALDLDASGIRIHGTNKDGSIGTAASHGCMRMHRWDIEDLFPRVPVGTPVHIVR